MPRLLLVEDSPDVTFLVQHLARREGLAVDVCAEVQAGWEALQRCRPDLVLLDLNLTGARGEELCRRVRADPGLADLAIALFTSWDRPADIAAGLEAGADYVVSKDLLWSVDGFAARLRELLPSPPTPLPSSLRGEGLGVRGGGRPSPSLLRCQENLLPAPSTTGVEALNRVLRHPLARELGSEVLRLVLRRAVRRAAGGGPDDGSDLPAGWLHPDGLELDSAQVVRAARPGAVAVFVAAVAEQLWCLLGTDAAAPLQQAWAEAVARLSG
jgi:CheY-like chemotaxis protein